MLLLIGAGGAGVLAWLGPPVRLADRTVTSPRAPLPPLVTPEPGMQAGGRVADRAAATVPLPGRADAAAAAAAASDPGTIPPPDPALQEASAAYPGRLLPRVGSDRRSPMQAYAAAAEPAERRPRIAIVLAGIGMSASESEEAIQDLPPALSLAVSPYAYKPGKLLAAARARGHEYLVSLPMEPQGYPFNDPGDRALMTGNSAAENRSLLEWSLTRFGGYVGATGALGGSLRGERFAASTPQMRPVLAELAARGLLYVDPRPGAPRPPLVVGRSVDVVIDEPAVRTEIEVKLARLEQIARDRGSAIGLASQPRPVTVDRLAAWANTLAARGIALMPVSAVVPIVPPPGPPSALTLSGATAP